MGEGFFCRGCECGRRGKGEGKEGICLGYCIIGRYNKRGTKLDTQGVVHAGGRFGIPKETNLTDNLQGGQLFGHFDSIAWLAEIESANINQYNYVHR